MSYIETLRFRSHILDNERDIYVLLPEGYATSEARYPVLYMNDGQNIFSTVGNWHKKWNVDIVLDRLYEERVISELIVVGITHLNRREYEFTPTFDALVNEGGGSERYLRFLAQELKPFIDEKYRTLKDRLNTGFMGSSLGGVITLEAARTKSDIISKFAAVSPSLWWDFGVMLERARMWRSEEAKDIKLWIDMGNQEGGGSYLVDSILQEIYNPVNFCRVLCNILGHKGFKLNKNLKYVEDPHGIHDEICWGRRFYDMMKYLFGTVLTSPKELSECPEEEEKATSN